MLSLAYTMFNIFFAVTTVADTADALSRSPLLEWCAHPLGAVGVGYTLLWSTALAG